MSAKPVRNIKSASAADRRSPARKTPHRIPSASTYQKKERLPSAFGQRPASRGSAFSSPAGLGPTSLGRPQSRLDSQIKELEEKLVAIRRNYDSERAENVNLKSKVDHLNDRLKLTERELAGKGGTARQREERLTKQYNILESRMERGQVDLNKIESENKKLKDELEGHTVASNRLESANEKMSRELEHSQKRVRHLTRDMRRLQETTDGAVAEMSVMAIEFEKEREEWTKQMRDMAGDIEREKKVQRIKTKTQKSQNGELVGYEQLKEARSKEVMMKWRAGINAIENKKLEDYERAMHRIHTITGEKNPQKAVDKFVDEDFQLTSAVEQLTQEQEDLNTQIGELKDEIFELQQSKGAVIETGKSRATIRALEDALGESEGTRERLSIKYNELNKRYLETKAGLRMMIEKFGDGVDVDTLTEGDLMPYLRVLEKLIDKNKNKDEQESKPAAPPKGTPIHLATAPKALWDMQDDTDSSTSDSSTDRESIPMTRIELKALSRKKVKQTEREHKRSNHNLDPPRRSKLFAQVRASKKAPAQNPEKGEDTTK